MGYISFFNHQLYLKDHPENYDLQKQLIQTLTLQAGAITQQRLISVFERYRQQGQLPMIIWNYSNLRFYDLLFTHYNNLPARDLTGEEAKCVFDAYLVINTETDEKFNIAEEIISDYTQPNKIAHFAVAKFMYQRDYTSTTEVQNQLVRGCKFFEWLESREDFKPLMPTYFSGYSVSGYRELLFNVQLFLIEALQQDADGARALFVDISEYKGIANFPFFDRLSINNLISSYIADLNFSILRNKMLYKIGEGKYILLNMNFLVNLFYKAHVFLLKSYFAERGVTKEFLQVKSKEFTENIYLRLVFQRCFPGSTVRLGDSLILPSGKELTDAYIREDNRIGLFELKDVMLHSEIKATGDITAVIKEIENKFLTSKRNKPKGVNQLINALEVVNQRSLSFDPLLPEGMIKIFPVILYTDHSFSSDGISMILNEFFQERVRGCLYHDLRVQPLTVINLQFFEVHENYFSNKLINLFDLIEAYHKHVATPDYHLTPFEVFVGFYMRGNIADELGPPALYNENLKNVMQDQIPQEIMEEIGRQRYS